MYIPGDYWAICQRTGIKFRISQLAEEPTKDNPSSGTWVNKSSLDPVNPQEYVQGVEDDPSVPLAFGDVANAMGETTVIENAAVNTLEVFITLTPAENDPIGIVMDNGIVFWSFATAVQALTGKPLVDSNGVIVRDANGDIVMTADPYSGSFVTLASYLHYGVSSGNTVYLPALDNEEWQ
jgi:hypothetical protein